MELPIENLPRMFALELSIVKGTFPTVTIECNDHVPKDNPQWKVPVQGAKFPITFVPLTARPALPLNKTTKKMREIQSTKTLSSFFPLSNSTFSKEIQSLLSRKQESRVLIE